MNRNLTWRAPVHWFACAVLAFAAAGTVLGTNRKKSNDTLRPVFSISDGTVWKLHPRGAWLDAYDISPDGRIFAAEFTALQQGQRASIWIGEWDSGTGKLMIQRSIEGPTSMKLIGARDILDLRFASSGHDLVALTGARVIVLDTRTLTALYSMPPASIQIASRSGVVIRQIALSADGKIMAVISSRAGYPWGTVRTRIFDVLDEKSIADWSLAYGGWYGVFSLSPDGCEMAVSHWLWDERMPRDILLVDARTGTVLRTFDSRFGSKQNGYGGDAQFTDQNHLLVASLGASHHPLKIVNLHTGRVEEEIGYSRRDASAWAVPAAGAPLILAFVFSSKWGIGSDLDAPFTRHVDWLAVFHLGQPEPLYIRQMVPLFQGGGPGAFNLRRMIRIAPDGRFVAFGTGRTIQVYRVESDQQLAQRGHQVRHRGRE